MGCPSRAADNDDCDDVTIVMMLRGRATVCRGQIVRIADGVGKISRFCDYVICAALISGVASLFSRGGRAIFLTSGPLTHGRLATPLPRIQGRGWRGGGGPTKRQSRTKGEEVRNSTCPTGIKWSAPYKLKMLIPQIAGRNAPST